MKIAAKTLEGLEIRAEDGEIGKVHDVFFEDDLWLVRYVVADTGGFLLGRKVLLAPASLLEPDVPNSDLPVCLTREQVKDSPDVKADLPLSRDQEVQYHDYFRWPYYWGGGPYANAYMTGVAPEAMVVGSTDVHPEAHPVAPDDRNPRLLSVRDIRGYKLVWDGEEVGTLEDVIVDSEDWSTPMFVLDVQGGRRLAPASLVENLDPAAETLSLTLSLEDVLRSPPYEERRGLDAGYLDEVARYYGTSGDEAHSEPGAPYRTG